jgi:type II secretory pathway component PulC
MPERDPSKGLTIPEVRDQMAAIIDEMRRSPDLVMRVLADRVEVLMAQTRRVYRKPVTRIRARAVTPEIEDAVREYCARNPTMIFREVGLVFNIDGGRVSEIVSGKRAAALPH